MQADSMAHSGQRTGPRIRTTRPKIFFLLDSLNIGGTEIQAFELAIRLDPERYEITFGCLRAQGPLLEKLSRSVRIVEFYPAGGVDSVKGMYQVLRLARFLRRDRFQIVHTHDLYSNLLGIPAAVLAGVPVIISSQRDLGHFGVYQTRRRGWLRRLQKRSAAVVTNSNAVRDAMLAEGSFAPEKIRVIYNGVAALRFRSGLRDRYWIMPNSDREKWIVLVGNMHSDVKGHPWFIEAAGEVLREFPQSRFVLVGDGALRGEFEARASQAGVRERFLFMGSSDEVPKILGCCDIAVLPSKSEGFPNALLEYLAAGLPTVATSVGGNVEIVRDGETGLLVQPENSSELAKALLRLLRDPDFAAGLGGKGREFVASEFSFQRMIESTDQLYTELLHSRGLE